MFSRFLLCFKRNKKRGVGAAEQKEIFVVTVTTKCRIKDMNAKKSEFVDFQPTVYGLSDGTLTTDPNMIKGLRYKLTPPQEKYGDVRTLVFSEGFQPIQVTMNHETVL